jgi:DNA polymerase III epsilon subunit-like protein
MQQAPPLQVVVAHFLQFCHDVSAANGYRRPVLVAHNANFDNRMLLNSCWQAGIDVPSEWGSLCTLKLAQHLKAAQQLGVPNCKLGTLAKAFGCAAVLLCCGCCGTETVARVTPGAQLSFVMCL